MRSNYPKIHKLIGLSEGGYVNHPKDPGGATDRGITQRTYDAWRKSQRLATRPVRGIAKEEAEEIIEFQYMDAVRAYSLPDGVDYAVSDYAVNSGPSRAAKDLQRCLGVTADGVVGSRTLAAVQGADAAQLVRSLCDRRLTFLRGLSTWGTFGKGWQRRVDSVRGVSIEMTRAIPLGPIHVDTSDPTPKAPEPLGFAAVIAAILSFFRSFRGA